MKKHMCDQCKLRAKISLQNQLSVASGDGISIMELVLVIGSEMSL